MDWLLSFASDLDPEFVEVRYGSEESFSLALMDGTVREMSKGISMGVGVRAFYRGAWGFSSTQDLSRDSLKTAAVEAVDLAKRSSASRKTRFSVGGRPFSGEWLSPVGRDPRDVSPEEKVSLVREAESAARSLGERVKNVNVMYADSRVVELTLNSLGTEVRQEIFRTRAAVQVFAHEAGVTERAYESLGGVGGVDLVSDLPSSGEEAARRAIDLLGAKPAPAGPYRAVLDGKLAGLFIHEAFGHATEADSVLERMSVLEGRVGTSVGSPEVNVLDDPTIPGLYGSYAYDSEGTPARRKYLVREGVLVGFLHNLETSSRMGEEPSGNGRAQGYGSPPQVRMSNTFIEAGDWSLEEMISEMREGIYAKGGLYGYTEPAKGQFMFKAEEGWWVEGGELRERLREVAIAGMTLDVLHGVDAVGRDLSHDPGMCGKNGQWVPVTTGAPHIRVERVVFGGLR